MNKKLLQFILFAMLFAWFGKDGRAQNPPVTASRIIRAASLPATCRVGDVYFKTAATVGTYQCKTANTWTVMGGGGSGCTTTGTSGQILVDDGAGGCISSTPTIASSAITASLTGHASLDLPLAGGTLTGDLLFTDATLDIGASGATRPRNIFLSGNGVVGGTLNVTGHTVLGVASATTINKVTITAPATGSTLTIPDGTTLNTGAGGTLGSNAFTSTAYAPTSTSISTTTPLGGGGDLSTNRTFTCTTCVVASSPGAGVAHFAGSTQTVTSSAVVNADITSLDASTKLTGATPVANGGTGTASTLTGLVRGNSSAMTAAELSGDATTSGSNAVTLASRYKIKSCVVIIGDPGAASSALADDNDSPVACTNDTGGDWTLTGVGCYANAGSPTVTPILTAGTSTSILSGALTCGTAGWAAGSLNGSPVIHSFSAGATCSSTPCTADVNITTAGGTAKYIVVRLFGTY